jgi:hypothetical protein
MTLHLKMFLHVLNYSVLAVLIFTLQELLQMSLCTVLCTGTRQDFFYFSQHN